jgi:hypothetical protein
MDSQYEAILAPISPISSPGRLTCEKRLWQAVLLMTVFDLRNPLSSVREDAQAWLTSDLEEVGSFYWVCDILGLDPEYIRAWFRRRNV